MDLDGRAVTEDDVARVLASCDMPDIGDGREVLHAQPVNFALDHRSGLGDPRGQIGNRLAVDMHVLTVDSAVIQNLLYCIKRCDLEVAGLASSAYVSGISALVEDEQELGAACIDLGGGSTGISIFMKKHMIFADSVRLGGDHVTSDISKGLHVPLATAERIKSFYGGVIATGMDDREMIEIGGDTGDWEHDRRTVSRAELIGIMRPRVEEILEEVRMRLDAAGFDHLQPVHRPDGGRQPDPGFGQSGPENSGSECAPWSPASGAGLAAGGDRTGALPRPWACAFSRLTHRTNGGISKCRPRTIRRAVSAGRSSGSRTIGETHAAPQHAVSSAKSCLKPSYFLNILR